MPSVESAPPLAESDVRYLDAILSDIEPLLGPGVVVDALDTDRVAGSWRLTLVYRLGAASAASEGFGESLIAAHASLRQAVVGDRIALSLRPLIVG